MDDGPLLHVIGLVLENTPEVASELRRHHDMHALSESWGGSLKRHVYNAGDWLLIWKVADGMAVFQRTGIHDELFR